MILLVAVLGGLAFANRSTKKGSAPPAKALPGAAKTTELEERKNWEASPDGIKYREWALSPEGKKVQASYDKIKKHLNGFTVMEAEVVSLSFQRKNAPSYGPKWLVVRIAGDEYLLQFSRKDFQQLSSLQVNDRIQLKSRSAGNSPNHPYLILSSDYIARGKEVLFARDLSKIKGC